MNPVDSSSTFFGGSVGPRDGKFGAPIFRQLFEAESSTYTYLLADAETREAVLIDPVRETVDRDLKLIKELDLKLKYILDTHVHADHITGAGLIREKTKAQTALSSGAKVACVDVSLNDGDTLRVGRLEIKAIATPGHTDSCMSYFCSGMVFTGDALLIRGSGRTDFQQGSNEKLYGSVVNKLFNLPDETLVYPGHDYRGQTVSTIAEERQHNPRLGGGKTLADFSTIMAELKLAHPKKIHEALPANLACGLKETQNPRTVFRPQLVDGVPEVTAEDVKSHLGEVRLIDVRTPEEFNNELGHIPGAELVTLGPQLQLFLEKGDRTQPIIFVCRSGGRSGQATRASKLMGYEHTINLEGGMIRWNELTFPTERTN